MTATLMALAILISSQQNAHTCVGATSRSNWADLDKAGKKARVRLRDGKHCVVVIVTVGKSGSSWPSNFRVGDIEAPKLVTDVEIWVDGCQVDQPWPPIGGMSVPGGASVSPYKGRWQLEISGSANAEGYGVRYTFDKRRVVTREFQWGTDWGEETRYDITHVPEISPQVCD